MEGFVKIRRGLLEHATEGKLPPFDFGLYIFMIMRADFSTGIYKGCALTIAFQFGDPSHDMKVKIQKALRRLRDRKYINYRNGDGTRGAYSILINKFSVTVGELSGLRLNAWKHGELCRAEYEPENGAGTEKELRQNSEGTAAEPNKELRIKETRQKKESKASTAIALVDPRHEIVRNVILQSHQELFRCNATWDASEGKALNQILAANPSWSGDALSKMVVNRYLSEGVPPARPRTWLSKLGDFAAGPLDRFGKLATPSKAEIRVAKNRLNIAKGLGFISSESDCPRCEGSGIVSSLSIPGKVVMCGCVEQNMLAV